MQTTQNMKVTSMTMITPGRQDYAPPARLAAAAANPEHSRRLHSGCVPPAVQQHKYLHYAYSASCTRHCTSLVISCTCCAFDILHETVLACAYETSAKEKVVCVEQNDNNLHTL